MKWEELTDREAYQIKRRRKNITLQQAAKVVEVHAPFLSNWENGTVNLNPKSKKKIDRYKDYIDFAEGEN